MFEALKGSVMLMATVVAIALYISVTEAMAAAMGLPATIAIQVTTILAALAGMRGDD